MAKTKRGTALFDVLSKDPAAAEKLKVPGWWESEDGPAGSQTTEPTYAPDPGSARPQASAPDVETADDRGSPFELDGDRIRLSLTSVSGAIVLFVGLALVFGSFELGRRAGRRDGYRQGVTEGRASYEADAVNEIQAARNRPPAADLLGDLLPNDPSGKRAAKRSAREGPATTVGGTQSGGQQTKWIRDYTYIVVQEFLPGRSKDAKHAQAFLAEQGVVAELVRFPRGSVQLITAQGYNRNDPTQRQVSDRLLERVRTVGAKYYAAGGGYKLDGYLKTLKGDTW